MSIGKLLNASWKLRRRKDYKLYGFRNRAVCNPQTINHYALYSYTRRDNPTSNTYLLLYLLPACGRTFLTTVSNSVRQKYSGLVGKYVHEKEIVVIY